jgi:hypothetical protein
MTTKNEYAEQHLRKSVLTALSGLGARLFRVNTGMAWAGKAEVQGHNVFIRDAYPIRMGLVEGGSDLVGWTPVTVTREMVGERVAIFTAIELKVGRTATTEAQDRFLARVRGAGGAATVARSVTDAVELVRAWVEGNPAVRVLDTTSDEAHRGG